MKWAPGYWKSRLKPKATPQSHWSDPWMASDLTVTRAIDKIWLNIGMSACSMGTAHGTVCDLPSLWGCLLYGPYWLPTDTHLFIIVMNQVVTQESMKSVYKVCFQGYKQRSEGFAAMDICHWLHRNNRYSKCTKCEPAREFGSFAFSLKTGWLLTYSLSAQMPIARGSL